MHCDELQIHLASVPLAFAEHQMMIIYYCNSQAHTILSLLLE